MPKSKNTLQILIIVIVAVFVLTYASELDKIQRENIVGRAGEGVDSDEAACLDECVYDDCGYGAELFNEGPDETEIYESNCCGDDTEENLNQFISCDELGWWDNAPDYLVCEDVTDCDTHKNDDSQCCRDVRKCVFENNCYENVDNIDGNNLANIADSGKNYAFCGLGSSMKGVWFDCDTPHAITEKPAYQCDTETEPNSVFDRNACYEAGVREALYAGEFGVGEFDATDASELAQQDVECCGDDDNEYIIEFSADDEACNQPNGCDVDDILKLCCADNNDCVYNDMCYDSDSVRSVDYQGQWGFYALCLNSEWHDCDESKTRCDQCIQSNNMVALCELYSQSCWIDSGMNEAFGEYSSFNQDGCCGDDPYEFFVKGTDNTYSCCNDVSLDVRDGECLTPDHVTITAISPTEVLPAGGQKVTIIGTNFIAGMTIKVDGSSVSSRYISQTNYEFTTDAHEEGTADVKIINNVDGTSYTLDDGLTFAYAVDPDAPQISDIDPDRINLNAEECDEDYCYVEIEITGKNFEDAPDLTEVYFGGEQVDEDAIDYRSSTRLIIDYIPYHAPGKVDVKVENPSDGKSSTKHDAFEYYVPVPKIESITPTEGPIDGGTLVTITGENFDEDCEVYFGLKEGIGLDYVDDEKVKVKTPAAAAGRADVKVENPDGESDVWSRAFRYIDPDAGDNGDGNGDTPYDKSSEFTYDLNVHKIKVDYVAFSEIRITVKETTSGTNPEEKVYKKFQIDSSIPNVKDARIFFKVDKSWISQNNIDKDTIALQRYGTSWQKLATNYLKDIPDTKYLHFESQTKKFSIFAITGSEAGGDKPPPVETCVDGKQNQGEEGVDCGGPCPACEVEETCYDNILNQDEEDVDCGGVCSACPETQTAGNIFSEYKVLFYIIGFLALGVILFLVYWYGIKPKTGFGTHPAEPSKGPDFRAKPFQPKEPENEMDIYIKNSFAKGMSREKIKNNLLGVGWKESEINKALEKDMKPEDSFPTVKPVVSHIEQSKKSLAQLDSFIADAIRKGHTVNQIRQSLIKAGWRRSVVDRALKMKKP